MTIFLNDDLAPPDGDEQAEAMAYDALVFELSVLLMRLDGNDGDPHQLVWEGGPIPEPWGDVWQKYEPQAKEVLGAIGEGIAQAMVEALRHMLPSSPSIEREVSGEASADGVMACHFPHCGCMQQGGPGACATKRVTDHMNSCPAPDWLTLAKQCGGTTYTNRHMPGEPAVAFGNESWARFTEALTKLAHGVALPDGGQR